MAVVVPPRGMPDFLPNEKLDRDAILNQFSRIYQQWGFSPIHTPSLERLDRLNDSEGADNLKLIFQVLKRGLSRDKILANADDVSKLCDLGLRYDLTVPLARYYASNQGKLPNVAKLYQYGNVYRAERPQKGRFRQFMQYDADILGQQQGAPEIELILCCIQALTSIGLTDFKIRINDRRILNSLLDQLNVAEDLRPSILITIDKLDKIAISGVEKELLALSIEPDIVTKLTNRLSHFVDNPLVSVTQGLKKLNVQIDDEINNSLEDLYQNIQGEQYQVTFDPTLVRGMGYYTGQIFEVSYADYPFSIAGGGRYDTMIGRFLNKQVPACGLSLGIDRIMTILEEESIDVIDNADSKLVLLYSKSDFNSALSHAKKLREQGFDVAMVVKSKNIKNQLNEYKALKFRKFASIENQAISGIKPIN